MEARKRGPSKLPSNDLVCSEADMAHTYSCYLAAKQTAWQA